MQFKMVVIGDVLYGEDSHRNGLAVNEAPCEKEEEKSNEPAFVFYDESLNELLDSSKRSTIVNPSHKIILKSEDGERELS